jgi:Ca2+/H+ antiporter
MVYDLSLHPESWSLTYSTINLQVSIILLVSKWFQKRSTSYCKPDQYPVYLGYLAFQLYSHPSLYLDSGEHVAKTTAYDTPKFRLSAIRKRLAERDLEKSRHAEPDRTSVTDALQTTSPRAEVSSPFEEPQTAVEEEEEEQPQLSLLMSVGLLVVVTVVCTKFQKSSSFGLNAILLCSW